MHEKISRENNFDLLRLAAAVQVLLYHAYDHLQLPAGWLTAAIHTSGMFAGVPVFFVISGYLVFASFDAGRDVRSYAQNRFLRIFPALWACLLVTIGLLVMFGYLNEQALHSSGLWVWLASQLTFFQFYTPGIFRTFGSGSPNGALWTIPVELGFYLLVPVMFRLARAGRRSMNSWMLCLLILSVAFNLFYQPYKLRAGLPVWVKLPAVSPLPYLFYFMAGALICNNRSLLRRWYEGKGLIWLLVYVGYCVTVGIWLGKFRFGYWTNGYHLFSVVLLAMTVVSLAYTGRNISNRLLGGNDLSYGVYLYHMPVINSVMALGGGRHLFSVILVMCASLAAAYVSWRVVEKPAFSLKRLPVVRTSA